MRFLVFFLMISFVGPSLSTIYEDMIVRQEMKSVANQINVMGMFIASEREFVKRENRKKIQEELEKFVALFRHFKNHPVIETQGLAINHLAMNEQLEQTLRLFRSSNPEIARIKFNGALSLCVSCHVQALKLANNPTDLSAQYRVFPDYEIKRLKLNDFEKAELSFVTRDFDRAMSLYDTFLINASIVKNSKNSDNDLVLKALMKELVFFVKIKNDFSKAKSHFSAFLELGHFDKKINQEVENWLEALARDKFDLFFGTQVNYKDIDDKKMEKFMKIFSSDESEGPIYVGAHSFLVQDLNLSSILQNYLNFHPNTKYGAQILYWLAIMDKRTSEDLQFSLNDFYLLNCMEKDGPHAITKKCYQNYVDKKEERKKILKQKLSPNAFLRVTS